MGSRGCAVPGAHDRAAKEWNAASRQRAAEGTTVRDPRKTVRLLRGLRKRTAVNDARRVASAAMLGSANVARRRGGQGERALPASGPPGEAARLPLFLILCAFSSPWGFNARPLHRCCLSPVTAWVDAVALVLEAVVGPVLLQLQRLKPFRSVCVRNGLMDKI